MATDRQIAANRRNAAKSTGPKTPEGKLIVSKNAVKHGLFADGLFLDEDPEAFDRFKCAIFNELCPEGEIERSLAERIAWQAWRLRRIPRLEAGAHSWRQHGTDWDSVVGFNEAEFRTKVAKATAAQFAPLLEAADDQERLTLFVRIEQQTERNVENGLAARAWDPELSAKLAIYEARSDRRLRKLIEEFTKFREARTRWSSRFSTP